MNKNEAVMTLQMACDAIDLAYECNTIMRTCGLTTLTSRILEGAVAIIQQ